MSKWNDRLKDLRHEIYNHQNPTETQEAFYFSIQEIYQHINRENFHKMTKKFISNITLYLHGSFGKHFHESYFI